jgi:hypothetical protein
MSSHGTSLPIALGAAGCETIHSRVCHDSRSLQGCACPKFRSAVRTIESDPKLPFMTTVANGRDVGCCLMLVGVQNACDWLVEKKPNIGVGVQRDAIDTCID